MCRIVTISGLSFTGTTTLASQLARDLGWNVVSAGQRFREFCKSSNVSLTAIPTYVHTAFDATIQQEIKSLKNVVIEGRYLGFFAKGYEDVLKVWIQSEMTLRNDRCLAREKGLTTAKEAEQHILARDDYEKKIGAELYKLADFTDRAQFDYVFDNNAEEDPAAIIRQLVTAIVAD